MNDTRVAPRDDGRLQPVDGDVGRVHPGEHFRLAGVVAAPPLVEQVFEVGDVG